MEGCFIMENHVFNSYTREEALNDGLLIDITKTAQEVGFKFPVAVTSSVWEGIVQPDKTALADGESIEGRLWDLVFIKKQKQSSSFTKYELYATKNGEQELRHVKAVIGPGDNFEPVITIMYLHED